MARALAAHASRFGKKVSFFMRKGADILSKCVGCALTRIEPVVEASVILSGYLQTTCDRPHRSGPAADSHQTWTGLRPEALAAGLAAPGAYGRRPECS